jgi:MFS family permease
MRRVATACFVGSAVETYDFAIYSFAAALVFPAVFFPHLDPTMATIAATGTFAAASLSRPLGAAVFGHLGDRLGRKRTLVTTLLIMALSTMTVGLVPSAITIGMAAPLILIGLRLLQGIAVGGEWAGAALLSAEFAPAAKRGRYSMFTPLGSCTGSLLASSTFLSVSYTIGEHSPAFLHWGWRLPFLFSVALIGVGLYVRFNIDETPVFAEEKARHAVPKAPLAELFRRQRREVVLAAGSLFAPYTFNFVASSLLATYAHTDLGYSRNVVLVVGALAAAGGIPFIMFSAAWCDRVGRRRLMLVGWTVCLPWPFVMIPLIDTGKPICYAVAIVGMYTATAIGCGPTTALLPELFATRYRYSGTAVASNLTGIVAGVMPPLVAGPLLATFGSWAIGPMLATAASITWVCTYLLPETKGLALQSIRGADDALVAS